MANAVSASEGAILRGAEATRAAREELANRIQTVGSHVDSLGSNFQGLAANSFRQLMVRWNEDSRRINNALETFEANLRKQSANLDQGESDQAQMYAQVASRLGGN
jgi:WXG100 family type VII secretion target